MRLLLLLLVAVGCGGGDDEPPSIGAEMCGHMQNCGIELSMTFSGCIEHMDDLFADQPMSCGDCMTSLTCTALRQVFSGDASYCGTCR